MEGPSQNRVCRVVDQVFQRLAKSGLCNGDDDVMQRECLQFCFMDAIQMIGVT